MKLSNRTWALIASFLLIGVLVYYFSDIVAYTLIAWVLSMIGKPLMNFYLRYIRIWKFRIGTNLAAVLTILTFFLVVGLLIWGFLPPIIEQVNNLAGVDYYAIAKALEDPMRNLEDELRALGVINTTDSLAKILESTFSNWLEPAAIGVVFKNLIAAAGNILVGIASVIFITFFFLREQGLFVNFLVALMPEEYSNQVRKAIDVSVTMLSRYFRGLLLQMLSFCLVVSVSLTVLGVPNALLIGFLAAVLNIIPYIGPIIGATFGVVLTISSGLHLDFYAEMVPMIGKVVLVFAGAQALDNYVIQPYIFSESVLAHPLEIFLVVLMGAKINGILGMVLAIPAYTVLRAVAWAFLSEFEIVKHLTERMSKVVKEDSDQS